MAPGTTPFNCLTFRNPLNPTRFLAGTKTLNDRWDFTQKGVEKKFKSHGQFGDPTDSGGSNLVLRVLKRPFVQCKHKAEAFLPAFKLGRHEQVGTTTVLCTNS